MSRGVTWKSKAWARAVTSNSILVVGGRGIGPRPGLIMSRGFKSQTWKNCLSAAALVTALVRALLFRFVGSSVPFPRRSVDQNSMTHCTRLEERNLKRVIRRDRRYEARRFSGHLRSWCGYFAAADRARLECPAL